MKVKHALWLTALFLGMGVGVTRTHHKAQQFNYSATLVGPGHYEIPATSAQRISGSLQLLSQKEGCTNPRNLVFLKKSKTIFVDCKQDD